MPGDRGGTISTDKPVPSSVYILYKLGAHFSGISYVLLSRDVIFACSLTGWQKVILITMQGMCTRGVICWSSYPSPEHSWFYHLCLLPSPSRGWSWGSPEEAFLIQEEVRKWKKHLLSFPETTAGKVGTHVSILPAVICTNCISCDRQCRHLCQEP